MRIAFKRVQVRPVRIEASRRVQVRGRRYTVKARGRDIFAASEALFRKIQRLRRAWGAS